MLIFSVQIQFFPSVDFGIMNSLHLKLYILDCHLFVFISVINVLWLGQLDIGSFQVDFLWIFVFVIFNPGRVFIE